MQHRNSGHVAPLFPGIERLQLGDLNLGSIKATGISQSLRKECKNLGGSKCVAGYEDIVERGEETNLDELRTLGRSLVGIIQLNDRGDVGGQRL